MKFIFNYLFLFFFSASKLIAGNNIVICGKIISEKPVFFDAYFPINGYYNSQINQNEFQKLTITQDSFYLSETLNKPSTISLFFYYNNNSFVDRSDFLCFPGDSVHIIINTTLSTYDRMIYSGDNAQANNLFKELNYNPALKFQPIDNLITNYLVNENTFVKSVESIIDSIMRPFEVLINQEKGNKKYFCLLRKNIRFLLFDEIILRLILYPTQKLQNIPWAKRAEIGFALLKRQPVEDKEIKSLYNYFVFMETVCRFQACVQLKLNSGYELNKSDVTIMNKGSKEVIDKELSHLVYIKNGKERENLWAIVLAQYFKLAPGYFDERVIDQYSRLFSNNFYVSLLREKINEINHLKKIEYLLQSPIIIKDSTGEMSFINDLSKISGDSSKNIFVDVWASWCGPCIGEFAYNRSLDSFLLAQQILKVYISLDNSGNKRNWLAAIEKCKLGGVHILAGPKLGEDIRKVFEIGVNEPLSIPRYLLINKKGEIINDINRPSTGKKLFDEISKALNL